MAGCASLAWKGVGVRNSTEHITTTTVERRPHLLALDGLRGVAAFGVVLLHTSLILTGRPWEQQAILAVDFFFMLSGFVVSYAYEQKLRSGALSFSGFLNARLIRLLPLTTLATIIGLGIAVGQHGLQGLSLVELARSLLLIPDFGQSAVFPLNAPAWSLSLEMYGSIIYAVIGYRLDTRTLAFVTGLSLLALVATAFHFNGLNIGFSPETYIGGPVRFLFSFSAGMLMYRLRAHLPRISAHVGVLAAILLAMFAVPWMHRLTPFYDLACAVVVCTLIISAALNHEPTGWSQRLSDLSGRLSYPLYTLHWPMLTLIVVVLTGKHTERLWIKLIAVIVCLGAAWLALKLDEPLRAWLRQATRLTTRPLASGSGGSGQDIQSNG